jgi:carbamoylphosphate synthase large subunit
MNFQGKRLLLLGGSNSTEDILRFAREQGITLIATAHPRYGITPLKKIAQESYDVNAVDEDGLVALIKEKKIDGIFPGNNEEIMPHAIAVAQRCHLPFYCSLDSWDRCANKAHFKKMCQENGIPVAKTYDLSATSPQDIPYPVAVKPADSFGSQGFSICHGPEELLPAVEKARSFSASSTVLIEDFIPYDAAIIHYTLSGGQAVFGGISDKKSALLASNSGSVMALQQFPSQNTAQYLATLDEKVQAMFARAGMTDGPVWIEAFNNNGQFIFNEMGYRFGGSMTYHPIRYFYGIDQLEFMLRYSLGDHPALDDTHHLIRQDRPAGKNYGILPLHIRAGTIAAIQGADTVAQREQVYAYVPIHQVGDRVASSGTVSQVFCYLHLLYDTLDDLRQTVQAIVNTLQVLDEGGNNILFQLYRF